MTRNDARAAFAATGLAYADLTRDDLRALRNSIDKELKASGLIEGYRSDLAIRMVKWPTGWAAITCSTYYFEKREAVTFGPDGFIGFGGWADDKNVVPIITGFLKWIDALVDRRRIAA
ncbi:hypothetical protein FB009_109213 [Sinorhizobium medicae]|uniref:hypothetical protein n=1 Tax=Sinorhizobium medicae TaxID=110321 RepID=UPI00119A7F77|nr:hypothetical protein [Sinorhizobium medicae]MDX1188104.1 hypothetical protein [Sinorhizobium medicae]MDX1230612.1 hypothetical protein [Sinorhizobium medicae]MQU78433.1 hypothetical protein [Sinorhizobium medicae]TWA37376.1 hypothetical protein FB009_109213 [Sinorhizobium medicae]